MTSIGNIGIGGREIGSSYGSLDNHSNVYSACDGNSNSGIDSLCTDQFGCYFCPAIEAVSYTHLDVYKRQALPLTPLTVVDSLSIIKKSP